MKDRFMNFIHYLFAEYEHDTDEYTKGWLITSVPGAIIFQVLFFFYEYYFEVPDHKYEYGLDTIIQALWWAYGGIIIYYFLYSMAMLILAVILHKKSHRIIMIIIGAVGTFFAYHRLK